MKGTVQKVLSSIYKLPPPAPPYTGGVSGGSCLKLTFWTAPFILVYPITMFTIFFGTIIIFLISFPSNHFVDSGAALTAASISALVAVKGMDSLKRTLPLKDTGYSKASSTRNFSSHWGMTLS